MNNLIKGRGFTDKLYFLNWKMAWIFTFLCFILNIFSGLLNITDLSIISVGIPAVFAELSLHTALIVWKAKVENCRKNKDLSRLEELHSDI
jgi:hypothetical protein